MRRNTLLTGLGFLLLGLILGLGVWYLSRSDPDPARPIPAPVPQPALTDNAPTSGNPAAID